MSGLGRRRVERQRSETTYRPAGPGNAMEVLS